MQIENEKQAMFWALRYSVQHSEEVLTVPID